MMSKKWWFFSITAFIHHLQSTNMKLDQMDMKIFALLVPAKSLRWYNYVYLIRMINLHLNKFHWMKIRMIHRFLVNSFQIQIDDTISPFDSTFLELFYLWYLLLKQRNSSTRIVSFSIEFLFSSGIVSFSLRSSCINWFLPVGNWIGKRRTFIVVSKWHNEN